MNNNSSTTTPYLRPVGPRRDSRLLGVIIISLYWLVLAILAICWGEAKAQPLSMDAFNQAVHLMSTPSEARWVLRAAEGHIANEPVDRVHVFLAQAKAWKIIGETKVSAHYRRMALTVMSPMRIKKALLSLLQADQEEDLQALGLAGYRARKLLESRVLNRASEIRRLRLETGGRDAVEDFQILTSMLWGAEGKKLFEVLFKREEAEARRLADTLEF